jgi:hypothetical protein
MASSAMVNLRQLGVRKVSRRQVTNRHTDVFGVEHGTVRFNKQVVAVIRRPRSHVWQLSPVEVVA